jgi:hypothetical protein
MPLAASPASASRAASPNILSSSACVVMPLVAKSSAASEGAHIKQD